MSLQEYNGIYQEAQDWEATLKDDDTNKFKVMYMKYNSQWWFKTIMAIVYIPAVSEIQKSQAPQMEEGQIQQF